jgi:hypothetical protein
LEGKRFQANPGKKKKKKKIKETPISMEKTQAWWHLTIIPATVGSMGSPDWPEQKSRPYLKNRKRAGALPIKCKALSSNPSTTKTKTKTKQTNKQKPLQTYHQEVAPDRRLMYANPTLCAHLGNEEGNAIFTEP